MAQITLVAGTPQQITLAPGTPITIAGNAVAFGFTSAGANAYTTAPQLGGGYLTMVTPAGGNPVSAVAYQNVTNQPYSVTVANVGGVSAISVNGVSVGVAAGTYIVPAFGFISITWTVTQPTFTWAATQAQVTDTSWPGIFINFGTEAFWVGVAAASGNATISYPS